MELKEIKRLIRLVDQKKFAEFELEKGDFKLRIKRSETPVIQYAGAPPEAAPDPSPSAAPPILSIGPPAVLTAPSAMTLPEAGMEAINNADLHLITSPIVGTFYCAPSPTAEPFVRVGDHVAPGAILYIVEAMKLMNEIPSDVAGEVVKVFAENAQPVEYGQPLFGIKVSA